MSAKLIRQYLRTQEDGATAAFIAEEIGSTPDNVTHSLRLMPDTYVDRYVRSGSVWAAVWMAVDVPEDCPRPEPKRKATV